MINPTEDKKAQEKDLFFEFEEDRLGALTPSLENRCWVQEHKSGYLRDPFLACRLTSARCQHRNLEEKLETEERLPCDICSHGQQLSKPLRKSFISTTGFVNTDKLWVF